MSKEAKYRIRQDQYSYMLEERLVTGEWHSHFSAFSEQEAIRRLTEIVRSRNPSEPLYYNAKGEQIDA